MKILGVSSHNSGVHDNSAAIIENGKILFAEAEERITRVKHDGRFPFLAIKEAMNFTKTKKSDIDFVASSDPGGSAIRALMVSFRFVRVIGIFRYLGYFVKRIYNPVKTWPMDKFPRSYAKSEFQKDKLVKISHYLAHAATAYFYGPFDRCLVVNMDGFGPGEKGEPLSGEIYLGDNGKLTSLEKIPIWGSLGLYYGAVTKALGFKLNDGEGKTMGLAAYGDPKKVYRQMKLFFPNFENKKWTVRKSIMDIINIVRPGVYDSSGTAKFLKNLIERYGRENVAASSQKVFEEILIKYFKYLVRKYKIRKVSCAGGIFLNVKANMRLLKEKIIDDLFIYPNPTDGGTALGAALAVFIEKGGKVKRRELTHPAYGRAYSNSEILAALKDESTVSCKRLGAKLPLKVAQMLVNGKVVGWFQGRGEWGPRALGQRSVIADPRHIATKDRINDILKGREWFMPFAPSILAEKAEVYLKMLKKAPFMIIADDIKRDRKKDLAATIHVDDTVRPHLVTKEANPLYWKVIHEFGKLTGVFAVLNTSFNKHGLPIVYSPKDAIEHLKWKTIDALVIGNFLVERK